MAWRIPSVLVSFKEKILEGAEYNWSMVDNVVTERRRVVSKRRREAQAKV